MMALPKHRINTAFFRRVLLWVEPILPAVEGDVEQFGSVVDSFGAAITFQRFTTLL